MATNKKKEITQNTPGWSAPPDTADTAALRTQAQTPYDFATPIRNQYARAETQLNQSYNNPMGAYTTADVKDKSSRAEHQNLLQNEGMALSEAWQASNQAKFGQLSTVAGLTAPRMYNAKSTTSQPFTGGDAANIGIEVGKTLLQAF